MGSTLSLLKEIYGVPEGVLIDRKIQDLIKSSQSTPTTSKKLQHDDIALIIYPDQLSSELLSSLEILNDFINQDADFITSVHILPFYPYSSDHDFSVIDYFQVKKVFGDWLQIKNLAHRKRLMFDGVINHVSSHSKWFKNSLLNKKPYDKYFITKNDDTSYHKVIRPRTSPLFHSFKMISGDEKKVWTTFSDDQIDLNFANSAVLLEILNVLVSYISRGAKMIRLDAIGFMWKQSDTTCIHLKESHQLIQIFRNIVKSIDPEIILVTEINGPH